MIEYWITAGSFGADIPENWEQIAVFLNGIIADRGICNDLNAVNELWEEYWQEKLPGAPLPKE